MGLIFGGTKVEATATPLMYYSATSGSGSGACGLNNCDYNGGVFISNASSSYGFAGYNASGYANAGSFSAYSTSSGSGGGSIFNSSSWTNSFVITGEPNQIPGEILTGIFEVSFSTTSISIPYTQPLSNLPYFPEPGMAVTFGASGVNVLSEIINGAFLGPPVGYSGGAQMFNSGSILAPPTSGPYLNYNGETTWGYEFALPNPENSFTFSVTVTTSCGADAPVPYCQASIQDPATLFLPLGTLLQSGTGTLPTIQYTNGNLSTTPEPPTFWLMATGILGMFGWVGYRRIKATA
jgi:hypothetical protein